MNDVMPAVRHIAQLIAGLLVGKGLIDESMTETVIGLVMSTATLAWMLYEKHRK